MSTKYEIGDIKIHLKFSEKVIHHCVFLDGYFKIVQKKKMTLPNFLFAQTLLENNIVDSGEDFFVVRS